MELECSNPPRKQNATLKTDAVWCINHIDAPLQYMYMPVIEETFHLLILHHLAVEIIF